MVFEINKKVIVQGRSYLVVLPKPWCRFWGITKRSKVKLLADSIILIIPNAAKADLQKIKKVMMEELR